MNGPLLLVGLWCWFVLRAKRLHDQETSDWWVLLSWSRCLAYFLGLRFSALRRGARGQISTTLPIANLNRRIFKKSILHHEHLHGHSMAAGILMARAPRIRPRRANASRWFRCTCHSKMLSSSPSTPILNSGASIPPSRACLPSRTVPAPTPRFYLHLGDYDTRSANKITQRLRRW